MAITNSTTFEKSIRYDRITRDYRAELDGQLIGYYPSYHAAEVALDQVAYDLLADETALAADQAAQAGAEPDVMTADVALHILGEINQAEAIRLAETRKTHASADARADIIREWQSIIDRKRTHLNVYGYRTQLSERTGAYVPSGNGHGWQYVSGERVQAAEQDGIPTCCGGQGCDACEDDNDDYGDALAEGAMGSYNGRTDRDARPTLADPAATRRYWCFVDGCSYEPRHIFGDSGLCCGHYGEYAKIWCDCPDSPFNVSADPPTDPDPGPGGDPWPDAPSIFRPVVTPSLLDEADAVLTAQLGRRDSGDLSRRVCLICHGDHSAEDCPRIRLSELQRQAFDLVARISTARRQWPIDATVESSQRTLRYHHVWKRAMNRWQRRMGRRQTCFCRACAGMHATQRCPHIWRELRRPAGMVYAEAA